MIEIFTVFTIWFSAQFPPWERHYLCHQKGGDMILEEQVRTPRLLLIWEWPVELAYWAEMKDVYLPEHDDELPE